MNKEYFENIARDIDNEMLKQVKNKIDNMGDVDKKTTFLLDNDYSSYIESSYQYNIIIAKLLNVLKNTFKKDETDFNTEVLAFISLYNFLFDMNKSGKYKINYQLFTDFSDIFEKKEKDFFLNLLLALKSMKIDDFWNLTNYINSAEVTYMCLAILYLERIFDSRYQSLGEEYDKLAICFSKLSNENRFSVLYGYDEHENNLNLKYYNISLPKIRVIDIEDLRFEYEENIAGSWDEFVCNLKKSESLYNYSIIINKNKMYDKIVDFIYKLGNYMSGIEHQNEKLKNMQEERYRIIRDFSHTYENMQAVGLKEIANILIEKDDPLIRQCGRVILAEYGIKNSLKAEVNLLRLNFEDRRNDIIELLKKGVGGVLKDNYVNANNIFEDAIKICFLRVIYSGNPKGEDGVAKEMYKRIKAVVGSMNCFVKDFEEKIIIGGTDIQLFLSNYGINFSLFSSEEWEKIYFKKNMQAEVLIKSIFVELITNILKYANLKNTLNFCLCYNDERFIIKEYNEFTENIESDSGVGLQAKGEILQRINGYKSFFVEKDEGSFSVQFLIDNAIFNGD